MQEYKNKVEDLEAMVQSLWKRTDMAEAKNAELEAKVLDLENDMKRRIVNLEIVIQQLQRNVNSTPMFNFNPVVQSSPSKSTGATEKKM